jgi:4'-phosphopantetheinyl transferase
VLPSGVVQVWRARLPEARAHWAALLDDHERGRLGAFHREEDRSRFLLGSVLVRLVAGACQGVAPDRVAVDRRCPDCGRPHGRVRVAGLHVSVSHSGECVLVAGLREAPVGVDVERVDPGLDLAGIVPLTLAPPEEAILSTVDEPRRAAAFARYWCRKEALVKMTGDGLRTPLSSVVVTAPGERPRLLAWAGRPELVGGCCLADIAIDDHHVAGVAYQSPRPLPVRCLPAADLLARL